MWNKSDCRLLDVPKDARFRQAVNIFMYLLKLGWIMGTSVNVGIDIQVTIVALNLPWIKPF